LNWRDLRHPEGGGSEQYVHRVAEGLAATGLRVRLFCAAHARAPADEVVRGVHVVRRGGRFGVYPRGLAHVRRHHPRLVGDVHNGVAPGPPVAATPAPAPRLVTVGRLVPHKRVEHAIDVVARLRARHRDLALDVVGEGWWDGRLRAHAREHGVDDLVRFHGFVDERTKHVLL